MHILDSILPKVLPPNWEPLDASKQKVVPHAKMFLKMIDGLRSLSVIVTAEIPVGDKRKWLHVSCSGGNRLPNWYELKEIKNLFIGKDRKAVQVLPPEREYVNLHPNVLHLYCCLDEDPLPDFREGFDVIW